MFHDSMTTSFTSQLHFPAFHFDVSTRSLNPKQKTLNNLLLILDSLKLRLAKSSYEPYLLNFKIVISFQRNDSLPHKVCLLSETFLVLPDLSNVFDGLTLKYAKTLYSLKTPSCH